jgi:hypothetical protein
MGAPIFLPSIFLPNPDLGSQMVDRKMRLACCPGAQHDHFQDETGHFCRDLLSLKRKDPAGIEGVAWLGRE